ncbi:uncharacterized protein [Nicotiana tomentosiformis]|uniref:uncharacterized protein isoform X2 n=1 Tax=Nicotiana tomentosiformis TaxID=4098 RepID=UPI00051BE1FC|nr:uncharacterized protein LOC104092430 isoform X2 [Nicotiana tomentosiformis]
MKQLIILVGLDDEQVLASKSEESVRENNNDSQSKSTKILGNSTTFKMDDSLKCGFLKLSSVSLSQKKTLQTLQCSSVDFPVPKGERKVHTPKVWFDENAGYIVRRIALVEENGFVVRRILLDDDELCKVAEIYDEVFGKLSLIARMFKFFEALAMKISLISDKLIRLLDKDEVSLVGNIIRSFGIPVSLVSLVLQMFRYLGFRLSRLLDFSFFQAEVIQRIGANLQNLPPDRYAVLVAEPSTYYSFDFGKHLVGAVDIIVQKDDVLQHLPEAEEYVYILGNAVLKNFRKKLALGS